MFAEMLSDMYTETLNSVNENSLEMCVFVILHCILSLIIDHSIPANLSESARSRLIHSLDRWYFEPHRLPDEEVLACTLLLFEALFRIEGMREAVPLTMRKCLFFPMSTGRWTPQYFPVNRTNFRLHSSPPTDLQIRKFLSQLWTCSRCATSSAIIPQIRGNGSFSYHPFRTNSDVETQKTIWQWFFDI